MVQEAELARPRPASAGVRSSGNGGGDPAEQLSPEKEAQGSFFLTSVNLDETRLPEDAAPAQGSAASAIRGKRLTHSATASSLGRRSSGQGEKLVHRAKSIVGLDTSGLSNSGAPPAFGRRSSDKALVRRSRSSIGLGLDTSEIGENVLAQMEFVHEESDYYKGFPVSPAIGWFRGLFDAYVVKDDLQAKRRVKSLLTAFDLSIVETLCVIGHARMFVRQAEKGIGLAISTNDAATAEFHECAQVWNEAEDGQSALVVKTFESAQSNICRIIGYAELDSTLRSLGDEGHGSGSFVVLQRYITPRGGTAPSLLRVAWRDTLPPRGLRFKARMEPRSSVFMPDSGGSGDEGENTKIVPWVGGCTTAAGAGSFVELNSVPIQAARVAEQAWQFTQLFFEMPLAQLVVDVLQGNEGAYHLIQVKAFTPAPSWLRYQRRAERRQEMLEWLKPRSGSEKRKKDGRRSMVAPAPQVPKALPAPPVPPPAPASRRPSTAPGRASSKQPAPEASPTAAGKAASTALMLHRGGGGSTAAGTTQAVTANAAQLAIRSTEAAEAAAEEPQAAKQVIKTASSCAMCSCSLPAHKVSRRMTPKMMLETEHHLRKRNIQLFHVGRLHALQLSQVRSVCDACWSLYLAETELRRTEGELARAVHAHPDGCALGDESQVPFGGILASVTQEGRPMDYSGPHKWRDRFHLHNSAHRANPAAEGEDQSNEGSSSPTLFSLPRRGGEAVTSSRAEDRSTPISLPVPPAVVQWRMLVHINRLVDIAPEFLHTKGLVLRLEVPWNRESPHDFPLPVLTSTDLALQYTTVHFLFTDLQHQQRTGLRTLLLESRLRFRLLRVADRGTRGTARSPPQELLTSELGLDRMLDCPQLFLAQNWAMLYEKHVSKCRMKLTMGLVCDRPVLSEYVVLRRQGDDLWVPSQPYFSSDALPVAWTESIQCDKSCVTGLDDAGTAGADGAMTRINSATSAAETAATLEVPMAAAPSERVVAAAAPPCVSMMSARDSCDALLGGPLLLAPRPPAALAATAVPAVAA